MHDLVHDLARLTIEDELIVFDVAPWRKTISHKYCRYALLRKYDPTMKLANIPSKVRVLRFSNSWHTQIGAFSFPRCLHTLDFSECYGILLPASIGQLRQLRCLIAPRMQNNNLPECITELSKLEYLNINRSLKITELPESIGNLGCLQYVSLSNCPSISKLPESFCDLKRMVHLNMSDCLSLRELPESVGNLTNLQHLELSRCLNVKAVPRSLCGLTQLQYLNLSSCAQIRKLPESLMKLQSLSHLNLSGCRGIQRGTLACLRGLTALQHLVISHLYDRHYEDFLDDFIATLTNLEHLDLSWNRGLVYLPKSIANLKRLHTLDLSYCNDLKSLPESVGTLGLKSLVLYGCSDELMDQAASLVRYFQTLPVLFKVRVDDVNGCSNLHLLEGVHVSELQIYSLENVRSLEEANKVKLSEKHNLLKLTLIWSTIYKRAAHILEDKDSLEQLLPPTGLNSMRLQGYSCTSFPGWLMCISHHLTKLVSIELHDLPMCSNLPPLGQLAHLEKLSLCKLPGIKRIDREFCGGKRAFRRLLSFCIQGMFCLEEWNTTFEVEDGVEEFMFPFLEYLQIISCPMLRLKPCPPAFLERIIHESDQVISSLEEALADKTSYHYSSSSSRAIKLDLIVLGHFSKTIRIFHHFPALRELRIQQYNLMSLPQCMRHLSSLESLTLEWCEGISALPEWLGDLSSLESLVITGCYGIQSLPACIKQLRKLQKLEIRNNQQLKNWCQSAENKA